MSTLLGLKSKVCTLWHDHTAGSNGIATTFFIRTRDLTCTNGNETINKEYLTNFRTIMEPQVFADTCSISANVDLNNQIKVSGDRVCFCKYLEFHGRAEVRQVFFVYFISLCVHMVTCSNEEGGGNAIRTSRADMWQCARRAFQTQKLCSMWN